MGRPSKLTDAQKVEARRRAEGATLKELAVSGWRRFRGLEHERRHAHAD
jgi:hypothetical protein